MGITHDSLARINRYLQPNMKMLELGAQNMYDTEHYGWIAKDYFESIPIQHISVDIIEHQKCVQCDLRELHPFKSQNDIVTNFGTLEHVDGSLYIPFKNIHNACAVGGIMIHENPLIMNWPGHGQHYFTREFYMALGMNMQYAPLEICTEAVMGNTTDGWNVCAVLKKTKNNEFMSEEKFNKIYERYVFTE